MMTPQNPATTTVPTAVYVPNIALGVSINNQGQPVVKISQLQLQGAALSAAGQWSKVGPRAACQPFSFGFDAQGNLTGLPADLQPAAQSLSAAYQALEAAINQINTIRKIV
jgi:hypothetical protein